MPACLPPLRHVSRLPGRRAILTGAASLMLSGCNPGRDLPDLPDERLASYMLGSGDQLRLIVLGEESLSGQFRVDGEGRIELPLLGSVVAIGLSPSELGTQIAAALKKREFLRDPSVAVEVVAYRPVFVLGEVIKPGQYAYQPGMTVLTAVAIAGGFSYRAVHGYQTVVRTRNGVAITGKVTQSSFLAPADVITVLERLF